MSKIVFLAHWSAAFVEEQFYALYKHLSDHAAQRDSVIYFCEWHNQCAVDHLLDNLFQPIGEQKHCSNHDTTCYPRITTRDSNHQLANCTAQNTLFVVYFPPRHLKFFLASTGQRFPARYVWWQVEQVRHDSLLETSIPYCEIIRKAVAVLEFSRSNVLKCHSNRLYAPFSRDPLDLFYTTTSFLDQIRIENICNHQKRRLIQDNPSFATAGGKATKVCKAILLGTCDVERRLEFKQHCEERGLQLLHPHRFNYLFGIERQRWIRDFVESCGESQAVAVNIHQYESCALEQAKIFLLLANGCDVIVSERSHSLADDALIETACNGRLLFADSLENAADAAAIQSRLSKTPLKRINNPQCYANIMQKLAQRLHDLANGE